MKIFNKGSNILLKKEKLIPSVYLYDELIEVLEIDSKSFLGFMTQSRNLEEIQSYPKWLIIIRIYYISLRITYNNKWHIFIYKPINSFIFDN